VIKIIINGREVMADPKKPLIAACHDNLSHVPTYCYHPGLSPVGSCRICQVEVRQGEMPPRVVVACRTPVSEGMIVETESERAHDTRRECLEFLLKNHPLDCPICDKAGECDLQDFSFQEGQASSRSVEGRRKLEKRKSLGDVILLDEERCILCSRCVRFMEEVPKTPQLTVAGLGSRSTIATFADRPLTGNYQGNLADVCPVGALTLRKFRFRARVWNLRKSASTCAECSRGCSITVEVLRGGEVKRLRPRPNEAVNGWWMCDHGRFTFDHFNDPERNTGALVRGYQGLKPCDSEEAVAALIDALRIKERIALVASPFLTVEEGESLEKLRAALGDKAGGITFVSPAANDLADDILHTGDPCPNRRGLEELGFQAEDVEQSTARIAAADFALVVGERVSRLLGPLEGVTTPIAAIDPVVPTWKSVRIAIGTPYSVEKAGTFVNVDGHRGALTPARSLPNGVRLLETLLDNLIQTLDAPGVSA